MTICEKKINYPKMICKKYYLCSFFVIIFNYFITFIKTLYMKYFRFYSFLFLFISSFIYSQSIKTEILLQDEISIRAIEIEGNKVYYSGSNSKVGYVDISNPTNKKQKIISDKKLQFRTLAISGNYLYTINVGSPAYFYKVNKHTLEEEIFYIDYAPNAFYDALVYDGKNFYTFSDSDENLRLKWMKFKVMPYFTQTIFSSLLMKKGEAAFATSNGNIAFTKNNVWLATGGSVSRVFKLNKKTLKIKVMDTPFVKGSSSKEMYVIDFYNDKLGIAVEEIILSKMKILTILPLLIMVEKHDISKRWEKLGL